MRKISLIISFCWVCQCCSGQKIVDKKIGEVPRMILLDSTMHLLVHPNQISEVHVGLMYSVYYEVLLDDSSRIKYISTSDNNFKSGEGIKVGDNFRLLAKRFKMSKKNVLKYTGWGLALELKSGWFAVFDFHKPIQKNSPILFFFQRSD